jgi:methyl-accepting chemotaxis protein
MQKDPQIASEVREILNIIKEIAEQINKLTKGEITRVDLEDLI